MISSLPTDYSPPRASSSVAAPETRSLLQAGPAYLSHLRLCIHHSSSFHLHDQHIEKEQQRLDELKKRIASLADEDDLGVGDEPESDELLALDPKEWKKQDHYAVLGLSHLRYKATQDQIKVAHRKKVLKHHPDKKAAPAETNTSSLLYGTVNTNDDAFFKCIQKAYEVLTNPERRRQFDSVDPEFCDKWEDAPTASDFKNKKQLSDPAFFSTFSPYFEQYSRYSRIQPVPSLGKIDSTKEEVEGFYEFWYNIDSWRSFEWLDKEVNEGSDSRDDKRYTEKKNKSERARRKKEDTAKVRSLVDLALSLDPRIKRIKQDDKAAREAKKAASRSGTPGVNGISNKEEDERRKREEEEKKKAEEAIRAEAKKTKVAAANAAKKARRAARAAAEAAGQTVNGTQ